MACNSHTNTTSCTAHVNADPCNNHAASTECSSHSVGSVCDAHSVSPTACEAHTGACVAHEGRVPPSTATVFTDPTLDNTVKVKAQHINELKAAITAELARRSIVASLPGDVVAGINIIDNDAFIQLRNALNDMETWNYPPAVSVDMEDADTIGSASVEVLRARTNVMETSCICECNYACTCQCNYSCTCQCNYACTCNCNYDCTCQCNYSCTCQCNYSCTCNCNYDCTCNCNYPCTCNCNYACTCNCNYTTPTYK